MKLFLTAGTVLAAAAGFCQNSKNTSPTPPYENTQVKAWLKVDIDKSTDTVHFIRDNNDPYVITKIYRLKHADAYEVRPYLRSAVQALRVDGDQTTVECIKYNNGANFVIISAEDFRFAEHSNGMGIDEIVRRLDQPKITSSSGQPRYFYFPSYRNAEQLAIMVKRVGANVKNEPYELTNGKDKVLFDPHLNCLFMYTPPYSKKNIEYMLKQYDVPNPEISLKYYIYEVAAENDGKMGLDFQAWKNNGGVDLLSTGARYRSNWANTLDGGMMTNNSSRTQFLNVNPKWNTKYFDFLTSKGHAKVITSGNIVVRNNRVGQIERKSGLMNFTYEKIPDKSLGETYMVVEGKSFFAATPTAVTNGAYYFKAYDSGGTQINLAGAGVSTATAVKTTFTVMKVNVENSNETRYYLQLKDSGMYFEKDGANRGSEIRSYGFELYKGVNGEWVEQTSWKQDNDMVIYKGYKIFTEPTSYGFSIKVTPSVCEDATILNVVMENDSLMGWNSDGSPRIAKSNKVDTDVMISHKSNRFVIGGLENKSRVRGVSGIPFLKDIPFLGWIFSTETESTKKSQFVMVAECVVSMPDTKIPDGIHGDILKTDNNLKGAGTKFNDWGFQQLILDKDAIKNWTP